jgi:hypothetical protein
MIICEMNSQWKSSGSTIIIWNIVSDEKAKGKKEIVKNSKKARKLSLAFYHLLVRILEPGSKKYLSVILIEPMSKSLSIHLGSCGG